MTQQQKRIGKWSGIAGFVLALLAIGAALRKPVLDATDIATRAYVRATVGDSLKAHARLQTLQLDSIKRQADAIRCVIDGDYAERHPDACKYGIGGAR